MLVPFFGNSPKKQWKKPVKTKSNWRICESLAIICQNIAKI